MRGMMPAGAPDRFSFPLGKTAYFLSPSRVDFPFIWKAGIGFSLCPEEIDYYFFSEASFFF